MDIHVDIREFLDIDAWVCYGFSDQGFMVATEQSRRKRLLHTRLETSYQAKQLDHVKLLANYKYAKRNLR